MSITTCQQVYSQYQKCLKSSHLKPLKCSTIETELRSCSESLHLNFCIDETIHLMNCARNPDKSVCAKQFLAMRECNRTDGPHFRVNDNNMIETIKEKSHYYNGNISESLSAPLRGQELLDKTIETIKQHLDFANFKEHVIGYQWDHSIFQNAGK